VAGNTFRRGRWLGVAVVVGASIAGVTGVALAAGEPGVSAPATTTTTTVTRTASVTASSAQTLVHLTIAPATNANTYRRTADFGGWTKVSGCEDTRAALLIRTSAAPVTFTTAKHCTVKTGRWTDPWSGVTTTIAHDFDIDHTVPLANAWEHGASSWTHAKRVAYANDLADANHLVPIALGENRSKGDRGPESWKPPSHGAWCKYAKTWDRIKAKWHLSATAAEWSALVAMAKTC